VKDATIFLQNKIGYEFVDRQLCAQALTHRSYGATHNERLEFLGDAVLDFLIAEMLYQNNPSATEGELSTMRAHLVRGEQLAKIGDALQLGDLLLLGAGEEHAGGRQRSSLIADAIEAVVAAVYLDGGLDKCREVVNRLFLPALDGLTPAVGKDAKTTLQEYLQARHLALPVYELVARSGNDHNAMFTMVCVVAALGLQEEGEAHSRKQAEQLAAKKILSSLKL
jgi:ribonuclease-3